MSSRFLGPVSALAVAIVIAASAGPARGDPGCYEEIDPVYYQTDVRALIRAVTRADVERIRGELIAYIWGASSLPAGLPEVESNVPNPFADVALSPDVLVDRLTVTMGDYVSRMHLFVPARSRRRLVILHQGHANGLAWTGVNNALRLLLEEGYPVLAVFMPLYGPNTGPWGPDLGVPRSDVQRRERNGKPDPVLSRTGGAGRELRGAGAALAARVHDRPLRRGVDDDARGCPRSAHHDQHPGGGLTPAHLRQPPCAGSGDIGDREQYLPSLYAIADYLDLYLLGSSGRGRAQLQVLNQYDSCCFAGLRALTYSDIVKEVARGLRGRYELFLDASHRNHMISGHAIREAILPFLAHRRL